MVAIKNGIETIAPKMNEITMKKIEKSPEN